MDDKDDAAADKIKRFLNTNGYLARKSDIAWILNKMAEALESQIEQGNGIVERHLLCEVITTDKEVKIITELPAVSKEQININSHHDELEINAENEKRTYYEIIHLPAEANTKVLKSTYSNGFLEVTLERRKKKSLDSRV